MSRSNVASSLRFLRQLKRRATQPTGPEDSLQNPCYAWEAEDLIAYKIMTDTLRIRAGRYVDIGAHHPIHCSNTCLFYQRGWRGLNVDATPGSMQLFEELRPQDINVEVGVAAQLSEATFYLFENPMLNGFLSEEEVQQQVARGERLSDSVQVRCVGINDLLETHLGSAAIDLFSIDIEGRDLEVLQDLDLDRWRPKMIICEILGRSDVEDVMRSEEVTFLHSVGYRLFSRLHFSSIFLDQGVLPA